jgi:hypothetical protein
MFRFHPELRQAQFTGIGKENGLTKTFTAFSRADGILIIKDPEIGFQKIISTSKDVGDLFAETPSEKLKIFQQIDQAPVVLRRKINPHSIGNFSKLITSTSRHVLILPSR